MVAKIVPFGSLFDFTSPLIEAACHKAYIFRVRTSQQTQNDKIKQKMENQENL